MTPEIKYVKGKKGSYTIDKVLHTYVPYAAFTCEYLINPKTADRFREGSIHVMTDRLYLVESFNQIEILKDNITTIRIPLCNSNNLEIKTEEGNTYLITKG